MIFVNEEEYKNNIGIYQIKNLINNKVYIGQTKQSFQRRYWLHKWKLENGSHDNKYLQNAWNKYGKENFEFSIIEITTEDLLNEKEKFWITLFKEKNQCYCIQDGGQEKQLNKYITPEQRKIVGEKNRQHLLGSHASEETKRKMSESRKGKIIIKKTNKIAPEQAKEIKQMLIDGFTPKEIMNKLNVEYKSINGIISRNNWANVEVKGWDDFQKNRPRGKGKSSVKRKSSKPSKISKEEIISYYNKYLELKSYKKVANFFNVTSGVVERRIKLYKQMSSQFCA